MAWEAPAELIGLTADERLLGADAAQLPQALQPPAAPPPDRLRPAVVGLGTGLTALSLLGGLALVLLGVLGVLTGGFTLTSVGTAAIGMILVATHWGWVHVAEVSANALEQRRRRPLQDHRRAWLAEIQPYTRYSVLTEADAGGDLSIVTLAHRPVRCGERTFTFGREVVDRDVHAAEEPAAVVAERAEVLRRQATSDTARERARYEVALDAFQRLSLSEQDDQQRRVEAQAGSQALSEQINSHLRQPPLEG